MVRASLCGRRQQCSTRIRRHRLMRLCWPSRNCFRWHGNTSRWLGWRMRHLQPHSQPNDKRLTGDGYPPTLDRWRVTHRVRVAPHHRTTNSVAEPPALLLRAILRTPIVEEYLLLVVLLENDLPIVSSSTVYISAQNHIDQVVRGPLIRNNNRRRSAAEALGRRD